MNWHMICEGELRDLKDHEQLFEFAFAYLNASQLICNNMVENRELRNWAFSSVVLFNAAHAIELFLKAALLRKNTELDLSDFGHNIDKLAEEYETQFTEEELQWNIPFRFALPIANSKEEKDFFKTHIAHPSIENRYPFHSVGNQWIINKGFEPFSFVQELDVLQSDFHRIFNFK
jgi:hypothetical protein